MKYEVNEVVLEFDKLTKDTNFTFEDVKEELSSWMEDADPDDVPAPREFIIDIAEEMMGRELTKEEIVELTLIYG